jgi:hypothetical protein
MGFSRKNGWLWGKVVNDKMAGHTLMAVEQDAWQQSPSIQQWRELYDAALKFKQAGCWNWLWDTDLFGVQNPDNGEVGYCCVMGRGGEHFALAVYLGTEGLETYREILRNGDSMSLFDAVATQKCLMASFEDRSYLEKRDFNVIKGLSLKFRGRNAWPKFRIFLPGCPPWFLGVEQARFLTICLNQSVDVALRFRGNPEMLNRQFEKKYLVRVSEKSVKGLEWHDEWMEPAPFNKRKIHMPLVDVDDLNKTVSANFMHRGSWETDLFYFPAAIYEKGQRPYFPRTILIVDHNSGLISAFHMLETTNYIAEFRNLFLRTIKNLRTVPKEVLVKNEESFDILKPIASILRIKLSKVKHLLMLQQAQNSFHDFPELR